MPNWIQTPTDAGNTGKKVRAIERVIGADTVYEHAVRRPEDISPVPVQIKFFGTAPATADTLLTIVKATSHVDAAGTTSIAVTAGKTLRITGIAVSLKANAAAAAFCTVTIRVNPSGAAVIGSPIQFRVDLGNTAATIGAADKFSMTLPEGSMELSGAMQLGISLAAQATTNIVSINLLGYEYGGTT
jgi:hypothetical protein